MKKNRVVLGETAEERKGRQVTGAAGTPDDEIIDDRMFDSEGRVWVIHPQHRRNGMLIWPVNAEEYIRDRGYQYMTQQYLIERLDGVVPVGCHRCLVREGGKGKPVSKLLYWDGTQWRWGPDGLIVDRRCEPRLEANND